MQTTTTPALHALHFEFTRRVREARQAKEGAERAGWYPRRTLEMLDEEIAALVGLLEHVERTIAPSERGETVNGGSLQRVGRLCARWQDNARTMDELADECDGLGEEKDAAECLERARTFRECANDLATEWAGTEPTVKGVAPLPAGADVETEVKP